MVAPGILLSSPGTGGTLYSLFYSQVPGPRSQVPVPVPSPSPSRLTISKHQHDIHPHDFNIRSGSSLIETPVSGQLTSLLKMSTGDTEAWTASCSGRITPTSALMTGDQ